MLCVTMRAIVNANAHSRHAQHDLRFTLLVDGIDGVAVNQADVERHPYVSGEIRHFPSK